MNQRVMGAHTVCAHRPACICASDLVVYVLFYMLLAEPVMLLSEQLSDSCKQNNFMECKAVNPLMD